MRSAFLLIAPLFAAILLAWTAQGGGDKKKKEPAPATKTKVKLSVLPHAAEKEVHLVDWRFVQGTRHFSLDGDKIDPKTKKAAAPEYLEFREEKSTTYKNGIFTLIPLTSIRKITYDRDKKTVAVAVATDAAEDVVVNGSTKFKGTNKITIEAEEILEGLGAATEKYSRRHRQGTAEHHLSRAEPSKK